MLFYWGLRHATSQSKTSSSKKQAAAVIISYSGSFHLPVRFLVACCYCAAAYAGVVQRTCAMRTTQYRSATAFPHRYCVYHYDCYSTHYVHVRIYIYSILYSVEASQHTYMCWRINKENQSIVYCICLLYTSPSPRD